MTRSMPRSWPQGGFPVPDATLPVSAPAIICRAIDLHWRCRNPGIVSAKVAAWLELAHASTGQLSWNGVDAAVMDAIGDDDENLTIHPNVTKAITDGIVAAFIEHAIEVIDDKPSGPTVAEIFRKAGMPT